MDAGHEDGWHKGYLTVQDSFSLTFCSGIHTHSLFLKYFDVFDVIPYFV